MSEFPTCPECKSPYAYPTGQSLMCPECGHEWKLSEETAEDENAIKDSNDNILADGDSVVVIKDLPVKGMPKPVKAGTNVKNIRIVEGDHNMIAKLKALAQWR